MTEKVLRRPVEGRMIAGVLAGLARYFGLDVSLLRLVFVLVAIFSAAFPGLLVYLIAWVLIPQESETDKPQEGQGS